MVGARVVGWWWWVWLPGNTHNTKPSGHSNTQKPRTSHEEPPKKLFLLLVYVTHTHAQLPLFHVDVPHWKRIKCFFWIYFDHDDDEEEKKKRFPISVFRLQPNFAIVSLRKEVIILMTLFSCQFLVPAFFYGYSHTHTQVKKKKMVKKKKKREWRCC